MYKSIFKITLLSLNFLVINSLTATANSSFISQSIFGEQRAVLISSNNWNLPKSYPSVGGIKPTKAPAKIVTKKKPSTIVKTRTVIKHIPSREHNVAEKNVFPGQNPIHVALIRGWITALDQAMFTGNYSVLRQLGSSQFQNQYKDKDLKSYFDGLKIQNLDLSPVLNILPEINAENGNLKETPTLTLTSVFPLKPNTLTAQIVYVAENNYWRVGAFKVDISEPNFPENDKPMSKQSYDDEKSLRLITQSAVSNHE